MWPNVVPATLIQTLTIRIPNWEMITQGIIPYMLYRFRKTEVADQGKCDEGI